MDTLSNSFKRMFKSEEEEEPEEEQTFFSEARKRLDLTWKQRIIGFLITFGIACGFAVIGVIFAALRIEAAFGVLFCIGTLVGVCSTFFLVSPIEQAKKMLNVVKIICVVVFVVAFGLTLCAAFWWVNVSGLAILFGIIQFVALAVYCVLLIPYAQEFLKSTFGKIGSWIVA